MTKYEKLKEEGGGRQKAYLETKGNGGVGIAIHKSLWNLSRKLNLEVVGL